MAYILNKFNSQQIIHLDGKEYDGADEGGNIWLKPSQTSGFWHWESDNEALIFAIKPVFLQQVAVENNCLNPDKIELLPVTQARSLELELLAMQFEKELSREELGNQMFLESLANMLAIHLLRNYCVFPATVRDYEGGLPPHKLKLAINYINDNLERAIAIADIAKLIDLSPYYFCHMFKQSMGIAPYKYTIEQRVTRAKKLIKQSKLPLSQIALECGFSSQSQMTLHFRKSVGVTPKVYRNSRDDSSCI